MIYNNISLSHNQAFSESLKEKLKLLREFLLHWSSRCKYRLKIFNSIIFYINCFRSRAFPSIAIIAARSGCGVTWVKLVIKELIAYGWLTKTKSYLNRRSKWQSCFYFLNTFFRDPIVSYELKNIVTNLAWFCSSSVRAKFKKELQEQDPTATITNSAIRRYFLLKCLLIPTGYLKKILRVSTDISKSTFLTSKPSKSKKIWTEEERRARSISYMNYLSRKNLEKAQRENKLYERPVLDSPQLFKEKVQQAHAIKRNQFLDILLKAIS